jgi:2-dehydro-3-deoxyglucarate aldolase
MRLTDENVAFKTKLRQKEVCLGSWLTFNDPCIAECMALAGFDFLFCDMEHSPNDTVWVQNICLALKGTACAPMVRVPWNDVVRIKRVLDVGAAGVLLPWVRSVGDVEYGVAACKYPPRGVRGYGPRRPHHYGRIEADYRASANDQTIVMAQIEHIDAVNCVEEIMKVDGLDAVFIGSNDLSGSMGMLGQTKHPDVLAAVERVLAAGKAAGIPVGIASSDDPADNLAYIKAGMQFLGMAVDFVFLSKAVDRLVGGVRAGLAAR